MAIPGLNSVMRPVLELIAKGATSPRECVPGLRERFQLTDEEAQELIPSGKRTRLQDRAVWALFHLMHAGLVARPSQGVYVISEEGKKILSDGPQEIDIAYLRTLSKYTEWMSKSNSESHSNNNTILADQIKYDTADLPPEERIESSFSEINSILAEEVILRILGCSPEFFERLIVDLLEAMGYGGGRKGAGRQIGRSGDGGIDGIINEDALGLDAVYVQAKRYQPDTKIGRPAIQQFVGSLTGEGATKGVFVTTSDFSSEARDYVRRVQQRIVLINGAELARLLIAHDIGVRPRKTYVLRSIDEDYFIES